MFRPDRLHRQLLSRHRNRQPVNRSILLQWLRNNRNRQIPPSVGWIRRPLRLLLHNRQYVQYQIKLNRVSGHLRRTFSRPIRSRPTWWCPIKRQETAQRVPNRRWSELRLPFHLIKGCPSVSRLLSDQPVKIIFLRFGVGPAAVNVGNARKQSTLSVKFRQTGRTCLIPVQILR